MGDSETEQIWYRDRRKTGVIKREMAGRQERERRERKERMMTERDTVERWQRERDTGDDRQPGREERV